MDIYAIISIIFAIVGILGGFLPVLPGPPLSWLALLFLYLSSAAQDSISTSSLIIWLVVAIVITVLDYVLPSVFTRITGGHKEAGKGAMIGLIVGMFFTPVGMVLGSFLGAFIAEYLSHKEGVAKALTAAVGSFLAFIFSTGLKVIFSCAALWKIIASLL